MNSLKDRFWLKVIRGASDECWQWTGGTHRQGYGVLGYSPRRGEYRSVLAHRLSWEIHNGPIPEGLFVLHRCDNPPCTNPNHLELGSQKKNMQDCSLRGRRTSVKGEQHYNAKLSDRDVAEIRKMRRRGATLREIAQRFSVSLQNVSYICRGESRV